MRTLSTSLLALAVVLVPSGGLADRGPAPAPEAAPTPVLARPTAAAIDAAVARGLQWLARTQSRSGSWTGDVGHKRMDSYLVYNDAANQKQEGTGHPGVTALAGLAFLADGQVPGRSPWSGVLDGAIDYLLRCGDPYDYICDSGSRMYSHSFAVLFLSQVHGMAPRREREVEARLRGSTRFILQCQNRFGAWRYTPGIDEADLSVTVCQVQALRAARNAGIAVSRAAIDRVIDYVKDSRIPWGREEGLFWYKIHGRSAKTKTSFAINAAAVTALHSAGVYDEREYGRALASLERDYDEISRDYPAHFYYWYGNYYAAQALHMEGGPRFDAYFARLSRDLLLRQEGDGSWANDVGPGPAFATAMACLLLRVPAALLPIFQH